MVKTTREQRQKLFQKWMLNDQNLSYRGFRNMLQPTFGCNDAVVIKWCGMWLCIETDGYCHT